MTHETIHSGLEKTGLADYLSIEQNEGLTCALTDEITGRSSTVKGTSYHDYKHRAYRAIYKLGYRSASQLVRSYNAGEVSGRAFSKAYGGNACTSCRKAA
jgi:hypothetical protein